MPCKDVDLSFLMLRYDSTTGTFTVPPGGDGLYYFSTFLLVQDGELGRCSIKVNGATLCVAYGDENQQWKWCSRSHVQWSGSPDWRFVTFAQKEPKVCLFLFRFSAAIERHIQCDNGCNKMGKKCWAWYWCSDIYCFGHARTTSMALWLPICVLAACPFPCLCGSPPPWSA